MIRDEFILFDTFKNINLLTFLICLGALVLGCKGKCASWMKNSWMSRKSFKCQGIFTIILIILNIALVFQAHEVKKVLMRNSKGKYSQHKFSPYHHREEHDEEDEPRNWVDVA
jgi:hypothetical protein